MKASVIKVNLTNYNFVVHSQKVKLKGYFPTKVVSVIEEATIETILDASSFLDYKEMNSMLEHNAYFMISYDINAFRRYSIS